MDGRAPAEPGWTDALRGVVDEEIDRDCETLYLGLNGLGAAGAAALMPDNDMLHFFCHDMHACAQVQCMAEEKGPLALLGRSPRRT